MPPPDDSQADDSQTDICHPVPCRMKHADYVPFINIDQTPVIWILGGPGCGKGTQCQLLLEKYGFSHLSSGDLLRAEVLKGGERAQNIENIMSKGDLVPYEIVLKLLREEMQRLEPESIGFLIDGYPREKHQCIAFEMTVSPVSMVIYFEASPETLLKRLKYRASKTTEVRPDDKEETFKVRIELFLRYNQPILEEYADKLHTINVEATVDEIFTQVQAVIDPLMQKAEAARACRFCKPQTC